MGSFLEMYNDLESLTLKYDWLILKEMALKIGPVSWLLFSAFIKPLSLPIGQVKVARNSFSGSIPPTFEHKLCHNKLRFGKISTTVV